MRTISPVRFLALVFVVVAINPALAAVAEENLASIFLKPVPAELSEKIEAGIKAIETKYPLDLVSRRSLVLAFAVMGNSKNEQVYLDLDLTDITFLAEEGKSIQARKVAHVSLGVLQFRAIGAGALPYLARKLAVQDDKARGVAFTLLNLTIPKSPTKYAKLDPDERELSSSILSRCLLNSSSDIRGLAAYMTGHLKVDSAVPELILLLKDEEEGVREMAAHALRNLGRTDVIPPDLLKKIKDSVIN